MYVYQADTYCDSCGARIAADLAREGLAPRDPSDEWSFDSDDFPKGPFPLEETDYPDHCASVADCLEPLDLFDYGLTTSSKLYGAEVTHIGALVNLPMPLQLLAAAAIIAGAVLEELRR